MRAKLTDGSHTENLHTTTIPWQIFSMDMTGPFMQASNHENWYQCAIIDTYSKYVWDNYLAAKDEVYNVLSDFCETEIVMLRGGDHTVFKIFLMSDLEEAHSKRVINLCIKYGIVKQATAGYTPQHNAVVERWFRTNGEMSRCQLSQFNMEKSFGRTLDDMVRGYTIEYHPRE
jgi:transposase InsO family protein